MTSTTTRPVVVGVDGRTDTLPVLDHAADEAARRGRGLHVVHARPFPGVSPYAVVDDERAVAEQVVAEAVRRVRSAAPGLEVTSETGVGSASGLLVDASRGADLVVVGTRGRGGVAGAFLGSTSVAVAAHAHCPVLVVRATPDPAGPVVVGTDGSDVSDAALGEAFAQAELLDAPLVVVHASPPWSPGTEVGLADDPAFRRRLAERDRAVTEEAVSAWSAKHPDVEATVRVVEEHPVHALTRESRAARLVVVGSRGRGGFTGLLLGSVSQGVLHHAGCPVLVVRRDTV